jgi:hypothetical protein
MTIFRFRDAVLPFALMLKGMLAGPEKFSNGLERRLAGKNREGFTAYLNARLDDRALLINELEEAGFRPGGTDENSQHFHYRKTLSMGQMRLVHVVLHQDSAEANFRMDWL